MNKQTIVLKEAWIETVIGRMIAISDEQSLYMLEFDKSKGLKKQVQRFRDTGFEIIPGELPPIVSIKNELKAYFEGRLKQFKTPYRIFGSPFQQRAWKELCEIPYGETRSYKEQAISLGQPTAYRAVANANGANQLAIIIPCHRIIASDGTLGGFGGGLPVKKWLLEHETKVSKS